MRAIAIGNAPADALSDKDVVSIFRARLNGAGDETASLLALQYGITSSCVHKIWRRELRQQATCHL